MDKRETLLLLETLRKKDFSSLKISLLRASNLLFNYIQEVKELNPIIKEREVYIETLLIKIAAAQNSINSLVNPSILDVNNKKASIIDYASILILTRSIFETYLTLEYLFLSDVEDDELEFRFKLWRMSGFMVRQNTIGENPLFTEKLTREKIEIDKTKREIISSKYYGQIKKMKNRLETYGIARIISWTQLIEKSRLRTKLFVGFYQLYSNYAHSEFISVIQLNEFGINSDSKNSIEMINSALFCNRLLIYSALYSLQKRYSYSDAIISNFDEKTKFEIDFWFGMATD
ncbi:DUF5677 domain-containing protein [Kaistella pullorum]|uniref:Uncharacterized protein n=1 Tax=Kaistella pullorum TaxID=2763074 RepID=A0ABR8WQE3_9FLAO|nr:DUF5677 domain-containing protein [Kaistella pullorum]MBD8019162.1 hypothetical protein [Kaistella pullorum]